QREQRERDGARQRAQRVLGRGARSVVTMDERERGRKDGWKCQEQPRDGGTPDLPDEVRRDGDRPAEDESHRELRRPLLGELSDVQRRRHAGRRNTTQSVSATASQTSQSAIVARQGDTERRRMTTIEAAV